MDSIAKHMKPSRTKNITGLNILNLIYIPEKEDNMNKLENLKKSFRSMQWYEWIMAAIMIFIAGMSMYNAFTNPTPDGNPAWLTVLNFISAVCGCYVYSALRSCIFD